MNKEKKILVKIQQSLKSSDGKKRVLVYDKARILFFESGDPGIVDLLVKKLGTRAKAYFKADIIGNELKIGAEIKEQNW